MNKMTTTRRSFLKSSLATGAAALVCGTKGQARVLGANDRLRIAVARSEEHTSELQSQA